MVSRDAGPEKASLCAIITFYYSLQARRASFTVEFAIFRPVFFAEIAVNIRRKICNDQIIHDDMKLASNKNTFTSLDKYQGGIYIFLGQITMGDIYFMEDRYCNIKATENIDTWTL